MSDHPLSSPSSICRQLLVLAALNVLGLGATQAGSIPKAQAGLSPKPVLAESGSPGLQEPSSAQDQQVSLGGLDEVLEATRVKLEELIAAANSKLRDEFEAVEENNRRLAADLAEASSRRSELESGIALAAARIAELTEAADAAQRESARLNEALNQLQSQNHELDESLARAEAAREAAEAKAEETQAEMADKLKEAAAAATRSKAELAAAKEALSQVAGAVVEAERARQAALSEADARQMEAAQAQEKLTAAKSESGQIASRNAQLEQRIASLYMAVTSATKTARQDLLAISEKIAALKGALDSSESDEAVPGGGPQAEPDQVADEPASASPATSQPPASDSTSHTDAGEPSDGASEVAMVKQPAAPQEAESALPGFEANIRLINDLELSASGTNLFSGVKQVSGHAVDVGATTGWESLPPIGQESYLESLLEHWVAERGGEGPAVVRIVDQNGRVLVEKSKP